ncbi:hypothetical protein P7228_08630 [Altererythrobacter arenosus]|uniref:Sulfotransferase family protein n=1 Tax=Altererythrobacter arenosus TaxID=3032592 RepID=A0ABY8FSN6_9SPHN|nr:hypothetical protein [Altererythrobacter sp. CAU 1644]WFL76071.1 hypothetical protein P7228_08630 [Altererythrobacter sp. CAU 1644]
MATAQEVLVDPAWLPHQYDAAQDRVLFLHIPKDMREQLTFLADYKPATAAEAVWVAGADVRGTAIEAPPVHYVFHTAFCRSTLMVKALDQLTGISGLSEPMIVNNLQANAGNASARAMLPELMRLLGRSSEGDRCTVVKPSNFANGIIPALLDAEGQSRAVLLYGTLRDFLDSVARKGLQGRIWGRRQLRHNQQIIPLELGMDERAMYELTDMQAAALAWLLHIRQFATLLEKFPSRLRALEANEFNAKKEASLQGMANFFGIPATTESIRAVVDGPLFGSHAKLGGDYQATIADQRAAANSKVTEEEIEQIGQWIEVIMSQLRLTLPLSHPLLSSEA